MLFLASNDGANIFFGIPFTQGIETDKPLLVFSFDRSILAPLDFIAHFFQLTQKGLKVCGRFFQDGVNILANLIPVGGALLIECSLFSLRIGHLFNDGQTMLQTDQVAQSLNSQSGIVEVFEFVGAVQRGGVEDDVVVYTLAENTEFMLSFLATFAQEESVKKSEAMNWSLQQRFKDGKLLTPAPLGYDRQKDVTGRYIKYAPLIVNESEAKIVVFIYDAYLTGWSMEQIALFLKDIGVETKAGGTDWNAGSIGYILTNERYCGNVLTWKTFTADLYEHKHRKNRQDRDQYLYTDKHTAIIPEEKFEAVQVLMENRKHHVRGGLPVMHVIDEGIFRGFIPINHHWVNDDPGTYYDISNSVRQQPNRAKRIEKSSLSAFDLQGYQVVRGQFLQIRYEGPTLNITNERIAFNKFCMQKFDSVAYVQLLLHPAERKLAIRPCRESDAHSIRWRPDPEKPLYSKTLNCQHFGNALYSIMKWNPDYTYKVRGTWASRRGEQIIVFNLPNAVPVMLIPADDGGEEAKQKKRITLCPEEWENDFGDEFYEHTVENGFYYIAPNTEWHSQARSVVAPGVEQYMGPSQEQLQMTIDDLLRGTNKIDGNKGN